MDLGTAVGKYVEIAGGFDRPVHLSAFGLSKAQTEATFSIWDEDYQISRYMLLSRERDEELTSFPADLWVFLINGHECTHVTFRAEIRPLLTRV